MFKETNYPFYPIIYFLATRKLVLREVEKNDSRVRLVLLFIYYLLGIPIFDLCKVGKAMIVWTIDPAMYFSVSLEHINETYLTSRKGIFIDLPSLRLSFSAFGRSVMPLGRGQNKGFFNETSNPKKPYFAF
jgi:hypothetical protein